MSVSVNLVGMTPGGGGSFPMAGTRPKVRKNLLVTSGSMQWVAPANVYFVSLAMCGAGGGASGNGYITTYDNDVDFFPGEADNVTVGTLYAGSYIVRYAILLGKPGASGTCIPPTIIPVSPGATYTLTAGTPGIGGSTLKLSGATSGSATGSAGGASKFSGDMIVVFASGGAESNNSTVSNPGNSVPNATTFGFTQVAGASGSNTYIVYGDAVYTSLAGGEYQWGISTATSSVITAHTHATLYSATSSSLTARTTIDFSRPGASLAYSGSSIATGTASFAAGGAPSLFSDGPAAVATCSAKPPVLNTMYGVGGAANAFFGPNPRTNAAALNTFTNGQALRFITTGNTASAAFGFGGDGGPGMVRIIWEE